MGRVIHAADLFCGAGGTSTGLALRAEAMGLNLRLVAVNHWDVAIETHAANHPWAHHLQTSLEGLKPSVAVPGGRLDLLVASPECTHHSVARGGRPRCDQSRSSAWHVLHWCQELYVKNVIVENVPEFVDWGPLGASGKPLKSRRGATFQAFVTALQSLGYSVTWDVLTCADYGDATTRRRFFLVARRGRRPIMPVPTHARAAETDIFGQTLLPWRPAREIIDWGLPGHSVFLDAADVRAAGLNIRRPLAANTLRRIEAGVRRYWGQWAEPFLVLLRGTADGQVDNSVRGVGEPVHTVSAGGSHVGLCRPFLVKYHGGDRLERVFDTGAPILTQDAGGNRFGLVRPLVLPQDARGIVRTVDDGLPTITSTGSHALLCPLVVSTGQTGGGHRVRTADEPIPTMVGKAEHCLVEPFVVKFYGTGQACRVDGPLATVTTDDRFGLVRPMVVDRGGQRYLLDILFRMLTPAELAAAHSFPDKYRFAGTKSEVVKQIGNSVPVRTAGALCGAMLAA